MYPQKELYEEAAFIAYYFHWSEEEVMGMEHGQRRRWCSEISAIHKKINPSDTQKEMDLFAM